MRTTKSKRQGQFFTRWAVRILAVSLLCCLSFPLTGCQKTYDALLAQLQSGIGAKSATAAAPATSGNYPAACAKPDFKAFFKEYMELPAEQQAMCVRYPLRIKDPEVRKTTFANAKEWLASENGKLPIILNAAISRKYKMPPFSPFFYDEWNLKNEPGLGQYCYTMGGQDPSGAEEVFFVDGGTHINYSVTFQWSGTAWLVTYMSFGDPDME